MMVTRHFAWFRCETGAWIGEWQGRVPAPEIPPELIGDARQIVLNAWLQRIASVISPAIAPAHVSGAGRVDLMPSGHASVSGAQVANDASALKNASVYLGACHAPIVTLDATWDLDAWDDCPPGGAVCLDVTLYCWPVGDFYWAVFDGVDQLLDFREMRAWLQLTLATAQIDASVRSPRLVRSTPQKIVADVTGTPLEPWIDRLHGQLVRRDGRIVFEPFRPGLPEAVGLSITDRNEDLALLEGLECEAIPLADRVLA